MTEKQQKQQVKINKNHGGKEFNNYFRFIGKVSKVQKKEDDDNWVDEPYFQDTLTQTDDPKPRKVVKFMLETSKGNRLKIEQAGMEKDFVFAYSSKDRETVRVDWKDRQNKDKLPNDTYHVMLPEWDLCEQFKEILEDDIWVEVKGRYEFNTFPSKDGEEIQIMKRIVNSITPIQNETEIPLKGKKVKYITDFDSPEFFEVNTYRFQIGIRSTYQDEETKDTKVNAVYLTYGKERSKPYEFDLNVFYKEAEEGKVPLATAFTRLNPLDLLTVEGIDNNRSEYTYIEVEESEDDNPFSDISEEEKQKNYERVISGTKKGLEILSVVAGSYVKGALTEAEISKDNPFDISDEDLPF